MKILRFISILLFCLSSAIAQDNKPDYSPIADSVFEDITLLHDRDMYIAGETIWFSAFIKNQTCKLSKVLYTELINKSGQSVAQAKFAIENYQIKGSLNIPEDIQSGIYFISAYTHLLANYPVESLFAYPITIVNPLKPFQNTNEQTGREIKVCLFNSIENSNVKTQLAFQIKPAIYELLEEIYLEDEQKQKLTNIKTFPNGLGKYDLPDIGNTHYHLKLKLKNGDSISQAVPAFENKGITLNAVLRDENLMIFINRQEKTDQVKNLELSIYSSYGFKYYTSPIIISTGEVIHLVPDSIIKEGLNFITLSDKYDKLISLEVSYKPSEPTNLVNIELDKKAYSSRELLNFSIKSSTPTSTDIKLNATVCKKGLTTNNNVLPYVILDNPLLLFSFIKNPANEHDLLKEQIEIMLKLYSQNLMLNDSNNLFFRNNNFNLSHLPETRGVSLTATVLDAETNERVEQAEAVLSVISDHPQFYFNRSMDDGTLIFPIGETHNPANLYLTARTNSNIPLQLKVNSDFITNHPTYSVTQPSFEENTKLLLNDLARNYQLETLFIKKDTTVHNTTNSQAYIFGEEMAFIELANYIELSSIDEIFKEIIPSAGLKKDKENYYFTIMDTEQKFVYENPLILLDKVPVYDINQIAELHPDLIDKIGIINEMYILGDYTLWGVISIYTNTDNFAGYKFPSESVFIEYQSISKNETYPFKSYSNEVQLNSRIPDFRNVLYWNPELSDLTQESHYSFYTSDDCSEYEIIIRGLDSNGKLYFGKTEFKVIE